MPAVMISVKLLPAFNFNLWCTISRGTPVARPLFFNFPKDEQGYNVAETEFMLGDSLLVAPVLEKVSENDTTSSVHISGSYFQPFRVPQT